MILILNCGSQSVKWKLFEKNNLKKKAEGERDVFDSRKCEKVLAEELNKLKSHRGDIRIIGHRVVHGGDKFEKTVRINDKTIKEIEKWNDFAPLHNPFNILGIRAAQKIFPESPQFAAFDTGFFAGLPEVARIYALPARIRIKYKFRRYGFHGISHEAAAAAAARIMKKPLKTLKIITCHLGGGSSVAAIKKGKPIDTSMGFTPLEGVAMMTRAGDIDPGIVLRLCDEFSAKASGDILNFQSGMKGIAGESSMLNILKKSEKGDKKSDLALEVFSYKIKKYIGAYFAALGGMDTLVFTGTIGYGSSRIRRMITAGLPFIKKVKIIAIKPDEELAIAGKILKYD